MGFWVPDDVSIIGWDDSLISQVVHPPLTAITRDITGFGEAATGSCSRPSTEQPRDVETPAASSDPGKHGPRAVSCSGHAAPDRHVPVDT